MLDRGAVVRLVGVGVVAWSVGCGGGSGEHTSASASASSAGGTSCTAITGAGQQIVDGQGNVWTLSGGVVLENGSDAGYSANVTQLVDSSGAIYQENSAGGWWVWSGGTWVSTSDPTSSCTVVGAPSPDCTTITAAGQQIVDAQGDPWTISGGVVLENGSDAGYSANVVELAYVGGEVYQQNSAGGWWGWSGGTWVSATDPTASRCGAQGGGGGGGGAGGDGKFHVSGGQIIDPNGRPFIAKGMNVYDSQMSSVSTGPDGAPLTSLFPGTNMVRLNVYSYADPSSYQTFINQLTAHGIVVELEDHTNNAGNAGGGAGTIYTGQQLTDELSWYASVASSFAGNPYVWFGTDNEPSEDPSAAALSTWQQQTYQAIRNAGNDSIVLVEMNCGNTPSSCGAGYTSSDYAGMTNIVWDMHFYGWIVGFSTDINTIAQAIAANAQASQTITSADGTVPVIIGEYGPSTDGQNTDANGTEVVTAVQNSGYGCTAWGWDPGANDDLTDGSNDLTSFGQQVAQFIAQ